jgi:hypothetical protein
VRVLSRLFRLLFQDGLARAHAAERLGFFGAQASLACPEAFTAFLASMRRIESVVYSKRPFGGPAAVLAYLACYAHRVAIANSRLIASGVSFRWNDYRANGRERDKVMRLSVGEFIRRFLLHVLPDGFHRIRHYGLFGNGTRQEILARACALPVLRRSHDPHREVRAWMFAPSSANAAIDPDRHLMTTSLPAPSSCATDEWHWLWRRGTGAWRQSRHTYPRASSSGLLANARICSVEPVAALTRPCPTRIRSRTVARRPSGDHNPHRVRGGVIAMFRGFLL